MQVAAPKATAARAARSDSALRLSSATAARVVRTLIDCIPPLTNGETGHGWSAKDANRAYKQAAAGGAWPEDAAQFGYVRHAADRRRRGARLAVPVFAFSLLMFIAAIAIAPDDTGRIVAVQILFFGGQLILWSILGTRASVLLRRMTDAEAAPTRRRQLAPPS